MVGLNNASLVEVRGRTDEDSNFDAFSSRRDGWKEDPWAINLVIYGLDVTVMLLALDGECLVPWADHYPNIAILLALDG